MSLLVTTGTLARASCGLDFRLNRPWLAIVDCPELTLARLAAIVGPTPTLGGIVAARQANPSFADHVVRMGFDVISSDGQRTLTAEPVEGSGVVVATSGTTGRPKLVRKQLTDVVSAGSGRVGHRWLTAFQPGSYGWWQVAGLACADHRHELLLLDEGERAAWWEHAASHDVTAVSAMPSFWRSAFAFADDRALAAMNLQQITLGGEPVDQHLLDRLADQHPQARLSHVYASTEAGGVICVHDGLEGFPVAWLDDPTRGLRIDGDVLVVAGRSTGDVVSERDGRIVITGRTGSSGWIKVGGSRVDLRAVEDTLLRHSDALAWVRAAGRPDPIAGHVTSVTLVVRPGHDPQDVVRALRGISRTHLNEDARPRKFEVLSAIPVAASGKEKVR